MTFLSDSNKDAYSVSPDSAATGPLVGFFKSFETSVDAQMRASAQYGIEYFMQELDWQQTKSMLDAGVENPPQLMLSLEGTERGEGTRSLQQILRKDSGYYEDFVPERSGEYLDVARRYAGEEISPEFEERLQAYDARVLKMREDRPDLNLMTSRQMMDRVKEEAVAAERAQQNARRTWGGTLGDFTGGALASMNPNTDPLNFYTLALGGAGKTALARIGSQVGAQGAIETVNQITGVQEERQLLGLSSGFTDAATRIGATALGAGVLQGAGEAVVAGARRWFRNTPDDPAPPVTVAQDAPEPLALPKPAEMKEAAQAARLEQEPRSYLDVIADKAPLSGIRAGAPRTAADLTDMSRQLDDWAGGNPVAMTPRTGNATFPGGVPMPRVDTRAATDNNRLYQMAREADPDTFNKYDRMVERRNVYRRWIDELAEGRDADVQSTMEAIDRRIHSLEAKLRTTQGKNNKAKVRNQIKEAEADRASLLKVSKSQETPDIARVRADLVKLDEKMRDVAPLIGRAYSRARGRWGETTDELDAVWGAYREGRSQPEMPATNTLPDYDTALTLTDRAPILRQADKVEPGATSADTARAIVAENAKVLDDAIEAYRAQIKSLVDVSDTGKLRVNGTEYEFDLDADTMFVPHESGTGGKEVKLREFLDDTKRAEDELEAVSTCSLR